MSMIIGAVPFKQRGLQMYVASVPIHYLERFDVDIWSSQNVMSRRGYQRKPDPKRTRKIAEFFQRKDAIMPVAGLLNVRERGKLKYKSGKLTIPDGVTVWVVDMQHRLKGLVQAKEQGYLGRERFEFPVVITEGLDQINEAAQFYIINTKAKRMDVALTRRLLIENEKIDVLSDVKDWERLAVRATIELNSNLKDNPWFGAIRQPNQDRLQSHIATEKSFVPSLRQIFIQAKSKQPRKMAKKLAAFWSAVRVHCPEAFREPRRNIIQKTPGMFAFNFFIAPIFLRRFKEADYEKKLDGLKKLGPNFWKGRNKNGAKRFGTGMGGYANLAAFIKKNIGF
jgi:DGQHR domain-containing protein